MVLFTGKSDEDQEEDVKQASPLPVVLMGVIFFGPALIIATVFYAMLRWGRFKFSVILSAAAAVVVALVVAYPVVKPVDKFMLFVKDFTNMPDTLMNLLPLVLYVNIIVGVIIGLVVVSWEIRQMKIHPYRLQLPGSWVYKFKYRRTPIEVHTRKKRIADLKGGTTSRQKRSPLGISEEDDSLVCRYHAEAVRQSLIVGAAGSGKSITMQSLILSDMRNQVPVFIMDLKASPEFASKVAIWAKENGSTFYHFVNGDPESYDVQGSPGQSYYDLLKAGTPTSKADMVLSMREFDTASEVYKQNLTQLLQVTFAMLKYAKRDHPQLQVSGFFDKKGRRVYDTEEFCSRPEIKVVLDKERAKFLDKNKTRGKGPTFNEVARLLDMGLLKNATVPRVDWDHGGIYQLASAVNADNLEYLCQACVGTPIEEEAMALRQLLDRRVAAGAGLRGAITELQGNMRTIIASEYGRWLKTSPDGEKSIDLLKLSQKKGSVVLFSLNSDSEPDFARYIGSLIMADFTNVSAKRRAKQSKNLVGIYVDEFQALNPDSVAALLEKSRESNLAMTLAQQSFEQIIKSSSHNGEAYLGSVLDTCSNFIIHAGMTEDSAEKLAKILGKHKVAVYTTANRNQSFFLGNNWRNRRKQTVQTLQEEQWRFGPERFMALQAPDETNGYKSTAVIVNKTTADPSLKGEVKGAVAREVWMIPDQEIVGRKYYIPSFESDGLTDEQKALVGATEEQVSRSPLFDEEDDYEDENVTSSSSDDDYEPHFSDDYEYEDEEDDEVDGSFTFEDIPEEEDDEEQFSLVSVEPERAPERRSKSSESQDPPSASQTPTEAPRRSTFAAIQEQQKAPTVKRAPVKSETKRGGLPMPSSRPSGGLPHPSGLPRPADRT